MTFTWNSWWQICTLQTIHTWWFCFTYSLPSSSIVLIWSSTLISILAAALQTHAKHTKTGHMEVSYYWWISTKLMCTTFYITTGTSLVVPIKVTNHVPMAHHVEHTWMDTSLCISTIIIHSWGTATCHTCLYAGTIKTIAWTTDSAIGLSSVRIQTPLTVTTSC